MEEGRERDGLEAARLLDAYLRHVEVARAKHPRPPEEPRVIVLPETQLAARRKKGKQKRSRAGPKKPAGHHPQVV